MEGGTWIGNGCVFNMPLIHKSTYHGNIKWLHLHHSLSSPTMERNRNRNMYNLSGIHNCKYLDIHARSGFASSPNANQPTNA